MDTDKRSHSFAAHKGMLLGFIFGAAVGALFGRISIGIALFVALGYLYDEGYFKRARNDVRPDTGPVAHKPPGEDA